MGEIIGWLLFPGFGTLAVMLLAILIEFVKIGPHRWREKDWGRRP